MTPTDHITQMPRAFDLDLGAEARALLPGLAADMADLLAGAGGSSPYLLGLMRRHTHWLETALQAPEQAVQDIYADLHATSAQDLPRALRISKARIALITALMDLGGVWPLETVTETLTEFASLTCQLALRASLQPLITRGKMPGLDLDALETGGGMVIFAMGKMGAGELNYSSDIDLICLFDQDRFDAHDFHDARAGFIRATRSMTKMISEVTEDGYVFRTDLRLRPDPAVTPVCMAMEAAERYYESLGRTWERAAFIKARAVAGDIVAGEQFLTGLSPFVWRKHLDFAAIEDAHNMRLAIRAHKGLAGAINPLGHNIKLGRGGIREIEFFTQTRQLIAGGRDATLRVRGTVAGLQALTQAGWLETPVADQLADHYRFYRTLEHRLQMVQDAQTHMIPKSDSEFARIACLMGQSPDALHKMVLDRLQAVEGHIEGFFAPSSAAPTAQPDTEYVTSEVITRWLTYPALRSDRAQALMDRLHPVFEDRLAHAARPADALIALEGFLSGLPAGVQVLSLFEANPQLIDLVLDVAATAPALADYLSRNAQVLDAVIGGGFFSDWPGQAGLEADLQSHLAQFANDYEAQLDRTRRWMKEWHFRIGVHVLRSLITAQQAGTQYADLARAVVVVMWDCVQREFTRKFGPPPGDGAIILGMGALGAGSMNAQSDLDLIVIFDAQGVDASGGPRSLATRPYFARLTQAMITALSAPMSEGRLYEVDMRLRPSGNQGPVATSFAGFQSYQTDSAWTWEHLAMTRATVIAGPQTLTDRVQTFLTTLLAQKRTPARVAQDVRQMRARIAAAKPNAGWLDVKAGPGQMQDIELFAQTGLLIAGQPGSTQDGLRAIAPHSATALQNAHQLDWQVQIAMRLLGDPGSHGGDLGFDAGEFLQRITGQTSLQALQKTLAQARETADHAITTTLNQLTPDSPDA